MSTRKLNRIERTLISGISHMCETCELCEPECETCAKVRTAFPGLFVHGSADLVLSKPFFAILGLYSPSPISFEDDERQTSPFGYLVRHPCIQEFSLRRRGAQIVDETSMLPYLMII
jgi:hypothetical protein